MQYPDFKYLGYKADLQSKTNIAEALPVDTTKLDGEYYTSIYRFPEAVTKLASLADLPDGLEFYTDYLIFDLDSHNNLGKAYEDTVRLCAGFEQIKAVYYVYFSGAKGFHVYVPSIQFGFQPTNDDGIIKRMAEFLGSRFSTFDPSIYNKTRIFRYPNTVNKKSGLYKIPLKFKGEVTDNFPSLEAIQAMAKEPADWDHAIDITMKKVPVLVGLYEHCKNKVTRINQDVEPIEGRLNFGIIKSAVEGNRNGTLYGICRDLARRSIPQRDANLIAHWWNKDLPKPLDTEEVDRTVHSAYTKGVAQLVVDNVFQIIYNAKKALLKLRNLYQNWATSIVNTGYYFLDRYTMGFFIGEVIFLISRPGNFKTCLLSNILHGISKQSGKTCLFFSMEMEAAPLTMRHIQKAEGMTQMEVLQGIKDGVTFDRFEDEFQGVHIIELSSLNTERILDIITKYKEEHGEIGAIGFDYLSLFEGCANNTERTARMATELKTRVAKTAQCPVFCLVQAKRDYQGNEGDIEIDAAAGKDSSSIEDSGDYLIGTWGHWSSIQLIDPITGEHCGSRLVKRLYGRFLKSRKFAFEHYQMNPYFEVILEPQHMDVKEFRYVQHPPEFKQKKEYHN